jgi:hypothetical protein
LGKIDVYMAIVLWFGGLDVGLNADWSDYAFDAVVV